MFPFLRSERGIGRGETAESQFEAPFFALFMLLCSLFVVAFHFYFQNLPITSALAVSLVVFGVTVTKVEFGVYILVLAMLLSPELQTGEVVGVDRAVKLRYDDIIIIVIFLGVMVKLAFEGRLRVWEPSPINAGIVAYFGVCIVSTLFAYERNLGAWDERYAFFVLLKMLQYYLIFFLVGHAIRSMDDVRRQVTLFFVVVTIICVYGIYTIGTTPRISAPFESGGTEPNTLGGYLVLCMCVSISLFFNAPTPRLKLLFLGLTLLAFVPMLYTLSRASYLAFAAGLIALALLGKRPSLAALVVIAALSANYVMPPEVQERVQGTFIEHGEELPIPFYGTITIDSSSYERYLVWQKVGFILSLGGVYTLLGGGVGWEFVLDSQYARVFLETGLLGFLAFAFMQYRILLTARQGYRLSEYWFARALCLGMFAGTIALMFHSVGTISFLIVRIMEPFWFMIALVSLIRNHAIAVQAARRAEATPVPTPTPQPAVRVPGLARGTIR